VSHSSRSASTGIHRLTDGYGDAVRHNFVNDIGDYAKYALLRALCESDAVEVRLGVIWYLTEHVAHNGDGRKRAHLSEGGWEELDPDLLGAMRQIEGRLGSQDDLNLSLIETSEILPAKTAYFSEPVPHAADSTQQRAADRAAWFHCARKAVEDCNLIFLDPDNGLAVRSAPVTSPQAGKYATVQEISTLLKSGAAVVLYQHGDRTTWPTQRERICRQISSGTAQPLTIRTLRFGAYGVRAFFCISPSPLLDEVVQHALDLLFRRTRGWDKSRYLQVE
jgi:hypothetical protein